MQPCAALKRLESLGTIALTGKRVNGVFRLLLSRSLWVEALGRIQQNRGAETPGIDREAVTDLDESRIDAVIAQLSAGTYRPQPVRRVHIPKTNGKTRPLGIPTATDRLVQEVVRMILNEVYEPIFSDRSHGFRRGRSCHTALDHVRKTWKGVKWLIEVDVEGYFDNISHEKLLSLLERRIDDRRFTALISAMLKAGYLEQQRFHETYSGTPQGDIVSPLLANVYLHELDHYVEGLVAGFDKGAQRRKSAEYRHLQRRSEYARKRVAALRDKGQVDEIQPWLDRIKETLAAMRKLPATDPFDPDFRRLRYVRYADDFLLGVIGSRAEAEEIKAAIEGFLASELELRTSPLKSGIREARKGARFLGYDVRTRTASDRLVKQRARTGIVAVKRTVTDQIQLLVPRDKVQSFSQRHGYGQFDLGRAVHRPGLLHMDDAEIVKVYNAELRGFANYYALAVDVKGALNKLEFLWRGSLFKTLAHKHRTSLMASLRRLRVGPGRYVVRIGVGRDERRIAVWRLAELDRRPVFWPSVDNTPRTEALRLSRTNLTDRVLAQACSACGGTDGPFHLHHSNPVRRMRDGPVFRRLHAERARKTRPLCAPCHQLLHAGKLPDFRSTVPGAESRMQ